MSAEAFAAEIAGIRAELAKIVSLTEASAAEKESLRAENAQLRNRLARVESDYVADGTMLRDRIGELERERDADRSHIDDVRGWAKELESALEWRPIETAPDDGTRVLLWMPGYREPIRIGYRTWDDPRAWRADPDAHPFDVPSTHWMPLPQAPDVAGEIQRQRGVRAGEVG